MGDGVRTDEEIEKSVEIKLRDEASESTLNDVLCDYGITETVDCYYIPTCRGNIYRQRKRPLLATERRLGADEEAMIKLCDAVVSVHKLVKKLNAKYGT